MSNSALCSAGAIRIRAYLVSTDHGSYLADEPNDSDVLGVRFAQVGPNSETSMALLRKLRLAGVGKPFVQLHGVFEGQLTVDKATGRPHFDIYSEIHGRTQGAAEEASQGRD